jgi:glycosyltransferase involved in cell wall biosynthesis
MAMSPLGRLNVFYHIISDNFPPIPFMANAFLLPDLSPLVIDYPVERWRAYALEYFRHAVEYGDVLFVFSEYTKKEMMARFQVGEDRIVVTSPAAASEYRPITDRNAIRTYLDSLGVGVDPYVLAVGTLEPRKDITTLVRAFGRLKREHPALRHKLVLSGERWCGYEPIFDAIRQEGLETEIKYVGRADRLELLYNGASLFVYPSYYEGFGLPPLEAMACGVPVITSNATSLPEVLGGAGRQFEARNSDDLCRTMREVLQNESHAKALGEAGVKRARHYNWDHTAKCFIQGLEQAIQVHKNRRRQLSV